MTLGGIAASLVAGLSILLWLLIPAASTVMTSGSEAPNATGYSDYMLITNDGKTYVIEYKITNGTVEGMSSSLPKSLTLKVFINTTGDGNLELKLPRELADRIANVGAMYATIPYKHGPIEVETTCDYRIFSIDFWHATETITLQGPRIGYINQIAQLASLKVDVASAAGEEKSFFLETVSYTKICSWEFLPGDKKLRIIIDGIMEARPDDLPLPPGADTGMGITIPKEMLGDPFVVMIDGERIDYVVDSSTENHAIMHFEYDQTSRVIEITGGTTTAIPEFGSISVFIMAAAMAGIIVFITLRRKNMS